MKTLALFLATTLTVSPAFGWDIDIDFDEIKKDLKGVTEKVSGAAQDIDIIPDEVKSALSSSDNILTEDTLEHERLVGKEISGRLLGAAPLVKDKKLQRYVNDVGSWVAKHSARPELKWHFGVIDSQNINAFSAPGGYVFLTKGLYKTLNSEAELASVLAHEISHVVYKHHLAILKKSSWLELGRLAIGTKVEDDKIENMVGSGAEIMARSLDKSAEFEADKMAVILTARAGYNAYALPIVLQQIGSVSLSDPFDVELLFKTHPHPNERLSELTPFMDGFSDEGRVLSKRFYRL